jgi:single-strand selective monofunctional uracil DNA glycosylase
MPRSIADELVIAARGLSRAVDRLKFRRPVIHIYNPLDYAWRAHEAYLRKYGGSRRRVLFLGMNPGPFGMVQTGVPFGEVNAVRGWMDIEAPIGKPRPEHPSRQVEGFACQRSEVSGRRLWGLFGERFGTAKKFFTDHFLVNYCPLAFFDSDGRNLTPDRLSPAQTLPLFAACDGHLRRVAGILQAEWIVGVGGFAEKRARIVFHDRDDLKGATRAGRLKIARILHPSPASPAANQDWAGKATEQLQAWGVWT